MCITLHEAKIRIITETAKKNKEKKLCKSRIICKFAPNNIIAVKFIAVKFYEEIL